MSSDANPLDPFNSSSTSATSVAASTVRPRNRRLISFVGDGADEAGGLGAGSVSQQAGYTPGATGTLTAGPSSLRNATPSPYSSRTVSPNPRRQFTRSPSGFAGAETFSNGLRTRSGWSANSSGRKSSGFAADLLDTSWSSLQGFASAVMGTSNAHANNRSPLNGSRQRKPSESDYFENGGRKRAGLPATWGPSGPHVTQTPPGSKEDRRAIIQSKKRELLLQANGDSMPDSQGNYKRRTSLEYSPSPARRVEQDDDDSLVYIHRVQPTDSLTGVSIRYGCPLPVLRKSNGFWPSDSIQSRKIVVLPVASCTLKGRRIHVDHNPNQLNRDTNDADDSLNDNSSLVPNTSSTQASRAGESSGGLDDPFFSSQPGKDSSQAPLWKHESWVEVDGFSSPVELGRVARRTLGFFPRARRKSQAHSEAYSDLDTSPSKNQTHRTFSHSPIPHSRGRSTTNSSNISSSSRSHQRNHSIVLFGPGGVGTLDRNATGPGPAPDKLNAFVSAHLPNLAISSQPPPVMGSFHGYNDRISFDSESTLHSSSSTTGLENIGGAIEGWFRKVATKAKSGLNELQQPIQPHDHLGIGGNGDLIELNEASEAGRANSPGWRENTQRRDNRQISSSSNASAPWGSVRGRGIGLKESAKTNGD
ncbi:predicted protein [Uncinocarpus reesii 1704]|uniref:LysM domain-containing protein n=1 Tax=Uncinocarpus reesii (strain UAMH 1704) TaxID=336963 RepID=C4JHA0_UNCRE|nr:uncharacterized protein UREG_02673 [Uncinocarpus reesii 1704]EEP77824.1 predicted protein [Uncinocarpus reesii 1704]